MPAQALPTYRPIRSSLIPRTAAYWPLWEQSGMALDLVGRQHLTDNNGVTSNPGKLGLARQYAAASSQYHSIADTSVVSAGPGSLGMHVLAYFDTVNSNMAIAGQFGPAGSYAYLLYVDHSTDNFYFYVSVDGTALVNVRAVTFGVPSTATWHDINCWYDSTASTINIQVNNGAVDSAAFTGPIFDSTAPFYIGRWSSGEYMNGRLNHLALFKTPRGAPTTPAERSALYTAGNGRPFPFRGIA